MSDDIKALKEALASVPSGAYVLPGIDAHKLARLLESLEAAERDAARYAWLRSQHEDADSGITMCVFEPVNDSSLEPIGCMEGELDAAIDAAMKKEPQP